MKVSDMLQIAVIGLSGVVAAMYLTRDTSKKSPSKLKKNPKKMVKTPEEIAQASSFLATIPQDRIDHIVSNRSSGKTSKRISLELGLNTQDVWDIVEAYETVNGPIETLARSQEEALMFYKMYQGPPAMTIEAVAEKANMSVVNLRKLFRMMNYPLDGDSSEKDEETRRLHRIYSGPDSPPLSQLAEQAGTSASSLLSRFSALGLPIMNKKRGRIKTEIPHETLEQLYEQYQGPLKPSVKQLAESIGISDKILWDRFKEAGFDLREASEGRKVEIPHETLEQLYKQYQGPLKPSVKQLAESIGVGEYSLYRRFKEAGFDLRETGAVMGKKIVVLNEDIDFDILYQDYMDRSKTGYDLEEKYGVGFITLYNALLAKGYPVAEGDRTDFVKQNILKEYGPTIAALYRQGANLQGIHMEYKSKVGIRGILAIFESEGISLRDTEPIIKYYSEGYTVERLAILFDDLFKRWEIFEILRFAKVPIRDKGIPVFQAPEYSQEEIAKSKSITFLSEKLRAEITKEKFAEVNALNISDKDKAEALGVSSVTFMRLRKYYE
jgi:AraC-like DNA-binding protein